MVELSFKRAQIWDYFQNIVKINNNFPLIPTHPDHLKILAVDASDIQPKNGNWVLPRTVGKPVDSEGSSYLPTVNQGFDIPPWAPKTTKTQNLDFGSFPQKKQIIPCYFSRKNIFHTIHVWYIDLSTFYPENPPNEGTLYHTLMVSAYSSLSFHSFIYDQLVIKIQQSPLTAPSSSCPPQKKTPSSLAVMLWS